MLNLWLALGKYSSGTYKSNAELRLVHIQNTFSLLPILTEVADNGTDFSRQTVFTCKVLTHKLLPNLEDILLPYRTCQDCQEQIQKKPSSPGDPPPPATQNLP